MKDLADNWERPVLMRFAFGMMTEEAGLADRKGLTNDAAGLPRQQGIGTAHASEEEQPWESTHTTTQLTVIMKRILITIIAVSSLASCATGPNAQRGAVIGGLGGAAVGGIIGNQSGRGLEGAAIGAGLGALAGNAIGDSQDRRYYNNNRYYNHRGYRHGRYYYYD